MVFSHPNEKISIQVEDAEHTHTHTQIRNPAAPSGAVHQRNDDLSQMELPKYGTVF